MVNRIPLQGNKEEHKIAIIIVYFGKAPVYLPYFLSSCSHNKSIDFYLFTDIGGLETPSNVITVPYSLAAFNRLATEKLGIPINIQEAYKLCDLKPAYGVIFQHYVTGYAFWGHGDIDVIYGRIRDFIREDILDNFDIISVSSLYISGFFCLYRNIPSINKLYEKSKDHKMVFESEEHYCFDECNFKFRDLEKGRSILALASEVESMTYIVKKEERSGGIRTYFKALVEEYVPEKLFWEGGRLSDLLRNREILLFHLIAVKNSIRFLIPKWKSIPAAFYITSSGFLKVKSISGFRRFITMLTCNIIFTLRSVKRETGEFFGSIASQFRRPPHERFKNTYHIHDSAVFLYKEGKILFLRAKNGGPLALRPVSPKKYKAYVKNVCLRVEFKFNSKNEPWMVTISSSHGMTVIGKLKECTDAYAC